MKKKHSEIKEKVCHMPSFPFKIIKYFFIPICFSLINGSYAETTKPNNDSLEQYRQLLAEQEKKFERQRQILDEQGKELERLKKHLDTLSSQSKNFSDKITSPPPPLAAKTNKSADQLTNPSSQSPVGPVGQPPPQSKEPTRPPEMPRLSETIGGVLTRKKSIVLEPSMEYAFTSNNRVFLDAFTFLPAIAIGLIDLRQVKRHSFFASIGARYGVTDRLEIEARIPYVYRFDTQRSRAVSIGAGVDETFRADGNNIGDIELAARYQLTNGSGGWPILVGNLIATIPTGKSPFDIKFVEAQGVPGARFPTESPTGTGYFSIQPSITALYPTDPAVFFGNINYGYNASTNENVGKIDPGDALGITFGMGFGVNERSSFNLGYSHRHLFSSKINGNRIGGSSLDIGQFLLGYSFKYSSRTNFNLSVGIGTTDDAQDVRLTFRVPTTF